MHSLCGVCRHTRQPAVVESTVSAPRSVIKVVVGSASHPKKRWNNRLIVFACPAPPELPGRDNPTQTLQHPYPKPSPLRPVGVCCARSSPGFCPHSSARHRLVNAPYQLRQLGNCIQKWWLRCGAVFEVQFYHTAEVYRQK